MMPAVLTMSPVIALWLAAGVLVGTLHAASLWYSARRFSSLGSAAGVIRLLVVSLALVGAALAGGFVPACVGWGVGFPGAAAFFFLRSRRT